MSHIITETKLSHKQYRVLKCLLAREPGEAISDIAERAGITSRTLNRYLRDQTFMEEFRFTVGADLAASRGLMSKALIDGRAHPSMQKLYWQLIGDFKDSLEISGPNGGPIEITSQPISLDKLSPAAQMKILEILESELGPQGEKVIGASQTDNSRLIEAGEIDNNDNPRRLCGLRDFLNQFDSAR